MKMCFDDCDSQDMMYVNNFMFLFASAEYLIAYMHLSMKYSYIEYYRGNPNFKECTYHLLYIKRCADVYVGIKTKIKIKFYCLFIKACIILFPDSNRFRLKKHQTT